MLRKNLNGAFIKMQEEKVHVKSSIGLKKYKYCNSNILAVSLNLVLDFVDLYTMGNFSNYASNSEDLSLVVA